MKHVQPIVYIVTAIFLTTAVVSIIISTLFKPENVWGNENVVCTLNWETDLKTYRKRCKFPYVCNIQSSDNQKEGRCVLPYSLKENESCSSSHILCSESLVCLKAEKICKKKLKLGDECTPDQAELCETGICTYLPNLIIENTAENAISLKHRDKTHDHMASNKELMGKKLGKAEIMQSTRETNLHSERIIHSRNPKVSQNIENNTKIKEEKNDGGHFCVEYNIVLEEKCENKLFSFCDQQCSLKCIDGICKNARNTNLAQYILNDTYYHVYNDFNVQNDKIKSNALKNIKYEAKNVSCEDLCCAKESSYCIENPVPHCESRKKENYSCDAIYENECIPGYLCVRGRCVKKYSFQNDFGYEHLIFDDLKHKEINNSSMFLTKNFSAISLYGVQYGKKISLLNTNLHKYENELCVPWQRLIVEGRDHIQEQYKNKNNSTHTNFALASLKCVDLHENFCLKDVDCWSFASRMGYCDVRKKTCVTPSFPQCLNKFHELIIFVEKLYNTYSKNSYFNFLNTIYNDFSFQSEVDKNKIKNDVKAYDCNYNYLDKKNKNKENCRFSTKLNSKITSIIPKNYFLSVPSFSFYIFNHYKKYKHISSNIMLLQNNFLFCLKKTASEVFTNFFDFDKIFMKKSEKANKTHGLKVSNSRISDTDNKENIHAKDMNSFYLNSNDSQGAIGCSSLISSKISPQEDTNSENQKLVISEAFLNLFGKKDHFQLNETNTYEKRLDNSNENEELHKVLSRKTTSNFLQKQFSYSDCLMILNYSFANISQMDIDKELKNFKKAFIEGFASAASIPQEILHYNYTIFLEDKLNKTFVIFSINGGENYVLQVIETIEEQLKDSTHMTQIYKGELAPYLKEGGNALKFSKNFTMKHELDQSEAEKTKNNNMYSIVLKDSYYVLKEETKIQSQQMDNASDLIFLECASNNFANQLKENNGPQNNANKLKNNKFIKEFFFNDNCCNSIEYDNNFRDVEHLALKNITDINDFLAKNDTLYKKKGTLYVIPILTPDELKMRQELHDYIILEAGQQNTMTSKIIRNAHNIYNHDLNNYKTNYSKLNISGENHHLLLDQYNRRSLLSEIIRTVNKSLINYPEDFKIKDKRSEKHKNIYTEEKKKFIIVRKLQKLRSKSQNLQFHKSSVSKVGWLAAGTLSISRIIGNIFAKYFQKKVRVFTIFMSLLRILPSRKLNTAFKLFFKTYILRDLHKLAMFNSNTNMAADYNENRNGVQNSANEQATARNLDEIGDEGNGEIDVSDILHHKDATFIYIQASKDKFTKLIQCLKNRNCYRNKLNTFQGLSSNEIFFNTNGWLYNDDQFYGIFSKIQRPEHKSLFSIFSIIIRLNGDFSIADNNIIEMSNIIKKALNKTFLDLKIEFLDTLFDEKNVIIFHLRVHSDSMPFQEIYEKLTQIVVDPNSAFYEKKNSDVENNCKNVNIVYGNITIRQGNATFPLSSSDTSFFFPVIFNDKFDRSNFEIVNEIHSIRNAGINIFFANDNLLKDKILDIVDFEIVEQSGESHKNYKDKFVDIKFFVIPFDESITLDEIKLELIIQVSLTIQVSTRRIHVLSIKWINFKKEALSYIRLLPAKVLIMDHSNDVPTIGLHINESFNYTLEHSSYLNKLEDFKEKEPKISIIDESFTESMNKKHDRRNTMRINNTTINNYAHNINNATLNTDTDSNQEAIDYIHDSNKLSSTNEIKYVEPSAEISMVYPYSNTENVITAHEAFAKLQCMIKDSESKLYRGSLGSDFIFKNNNIVDLKVKKYAVFNSLKPSKNEILNDDNKNKIGNVLYQFNDKNWNVALLIRLEFLRNVEYITSKFSPKEFKDKFVQNIAEVLGIQSKRINLLAMCATKQPIENNLGVEENLSIKEDYIILDFEILPPTSEELNHCFNKRCSQKSEKHLYDTPHKCLVETIDQSINSSNCDENNIFEEKNYKNLNECVSFSRNMRNTTFTNCDFNKETSSLFLLKKFDSSLDEFQNIEHYDNEMDYEALLTPTVYTEESFKKFMNNTEQNIPCLDFCKNSTIKKEILILEKKMLPNQLNVKRENINFIHYMHNDTYNLNFDYLQDKAQNMDNNNKYLLDEVHYLGEKSNKINYNKYNVDCNDGNSYYSKTSNENIKNIDSNKHELRPELGKQKIKKNSQTNFVNYSNKHLPMFNSANTNFIELENLQAPSPIRSDFVNAFVESVLLTFSNNTKSSKKNDYSTLYNNKSLEIYYSNSSITGS